MPNPEILDRFVDAIPAICYFAIGLSAVSAGVVFYHEIKKYRSPKEQLDYYLKIEDESMDQTTLAFYEENVGKRDS